MLTMNSVKILHAVRSAITAITELLVFISTVVRLPVLTSYPSDLSIHNFLVDPFEF